MRSTYGIHVATHTDKYFHLLERFERLFHAGAVSSWLDFCPLREVLGLQIRLCVLTDLLSVDRVPVWFPGAWFIKFIQGRLGSPLHCSEAINTQCLESKPLVRELQDLPLKKAEEDMVSRSRWHTLKYDRLMIFNHQELDPTKPSFVSRYLENIPKAERPYSDEYHTVKMVAHQIIAGAKSRACVPDCFLHHLETI